MTTKILNIGVKKQKNKQIKKFLNDNGIFATPKFIEKGSLKNTIRLYKKTKDYQNGSRFIHFTEKELDKLIEIGFKNFDCQPIDTNYQSLTLFLRHFKFLKTI